MALMLASVYRQVGNGKNVVVLLHGGPGSDCDGGYDRRGLRWQRSS